jgi:hypothetical protein
MRYFTLRLLIIGLMVSFSLPSFSQKHSLKGDGQVFWSTTFDWGDPDAPRGWSLPEGYYFEDPDNNGYNWQWYPNDSLIAEWTREAPFQSTSKADGHLGLFLNEYNNYLTERINVNNSVVFPDFDFSDKSSVVVQFEETFMNYEIYGDKNWDMILEVTADEGVHWAAFDVSLGARHKERPLDLPSGVPALYEGNISEVVAGAPNVTMKLTWRNTSLYFWMVDDFKISEAYDNDLRMKHYTLEWDDGDDMTKESVITYIPISQIGEGIGGAFTNFQTSVLNFGEMDQYGVEFEIDISKNNQSIWNQKSELGSLPMLVLDTVNITEPFTPTEFGHYKISYTFNQEDEEQTPEDNSAEIFFNVTDSVYARCDDISTEAYNYGLLGYEPDGEPDEQHFVGGIFPIYGDCEISSLSVFIEGGLADGDIELRGAVYWIPPEDEEDQTPIELLFSDIVTLDSSMFNNWYTFNLEKDGELEFLYSGDVVYAGVEYWNWHTELVPYRRYENLKLGSNKGVTLHDPVSVARSGVDADWTSGAGGQLARRKIMVHLNLNDHSNETDGVDITTALNSLDQNYPNPVKGSTEIAYQLAGASDVILEITDMTGKTVMELNEGNRPAGKHTIRVNTESLESGVYFYILKAGNFVDTKRMVVSE